MNAFTYCSPTKIIFGKDEEKNIGAELSAFHPKKALLHYGGGSMKRSGLYDRVVESLKQAGVPFVELPGVKPNPRLSLVREGIDLCRREGVDFILAVGGGSVIDSAKAIAVGVPYSGDVWDFWMRRAVPKVSLPVATILTIPAAGSETSNSSVITDEDSGDKIGLTDELLRPRLSILNPALCVTLPSYQIACGASDIMAHLMERYFTRTPGVDFSDRLLESSMRSLRYTAPRLLRDPNNYDLQSNLMWIGCLAHNGVFGMGRAEDWASHGIEHELSACYDIAHGAGLAVIFPAWMKYVYATDKNRFMQFAVRVFDVDLAFTDEDAVIREGIARLENFYYSLDLPTRLPGLQIDNTHFTEMAAKAVRFGPLGNFRKLDKNDIIQIYQLAL